MHEFMVQNFEKFTQQRGHIVLLAIIGPTTVYNPKPDLEIGISHQKEIDFC